MTDAMKYEEVENKIYVDAEMEENYIITYTVDNHMQAIGEKPHSEITEKIEISDLDSYSFYDYLTDHIDYVCYHDMTTGEDIESNYTDVIDNNDGTYDVIDYDNDNYIIARYIIVSIAHDCTYYRYAADKDGEVKAISSEEEDYITEDIVKAYLEDGYDHVEIVTEKVTEYDQEYSDDDDEISEGSAVARFWLEDGEVVGENIY